MRWDEIMERRFNRNLGKVSRDEFVYYAKTFAAEYQYLRSNGLLQHALNGSLGSIHYANFASETTIKSDLPVQEANNQDKPSIKTTAIIKEEPKSLGKSYKSDKVILPLKLSNPIITDVSLFEITNLGQFEQLYNRFSISSIYID